MNNLKVLVEISGKKVHVGDILFKPDEGYQFVYEKDYLRGEKSHSVSLQFPLQEQPFSKEQTRCFFDGLLPEGFTRKSVAGVLHIDENDYISFLQILGRECIGAIQIVDDDANITEPSYEKLTRAEIKKLAIEGTNKSAAIIAKTRLSLAGASGKVGLYFDGKNWFLPKGDAPSTHIVKQSHIRLDGIVLNEYFMLTVAKLVGIEAVDSFIINTGNANDKDILYATKRFDRRILGNPDMISQKPRPLRLHQEDFAQAMGISPESKYEKRGQHYFRDMCSILRASSSSPMEDIKKLLDLTIFNYLTGNTDNHIKNHSIIYSESLDNKKLAPAYDMICTCIYEGTSREMAFSIDGKYLIDEINIESFLNEADRLGVGKAMVSDRFNRVANKLEEAMNEAARIIKNDGYKEVMALKQKIIKSGTGERLSR